jgi:hypothetical protein
MDGVWPNMEHNVSLDLVTTYFSNFLVEVCIAWYIMTPSN